MPTKTDTAVGFIGLGVMGQAMARNLLKAGFSLTVHNRSRAKVEELVKEGAQAADAPDEVARRVDLLFTCLPDTPDVEAVLLGPQGVVEGARAGLLVIEASTISAPATIDMARRLAVQGVAMIDSPISGGAKGAAAGTLVCMLGGREEDVARARPALEAVAKTLVHVGPVGAGQTVKSCNQLVVLATLLAVSEAISLCRKTGIDPAKMRQALLGGSARSFVLENHAQRLLDKTLAPGFRAALMRKDINLTLEAGRKAGAFLPVTALGAQFLEAFCSSGRGGLDNAALGLLIQELSGLATD